jgi:hypothetical protein
VPPVKLSWQKSPSGQPSPKVHAPPSGTDGVEQVPMQHPVAPVHVMLPQVFDWQT